MAKFGLIPRGLKQIGQLDIMGENQCGAGNLGEKAPKAKKQMTFLN